MWCPVISGERVYIVAPDRYMTAIDRNTGATALARQLLPLSREHGTKRRWLQGICQNHGRRTRGNRCHHPEFRELWTVDMGLGYEHAPCIVAEHNGIVYAGSRRGIITMVDPENTDRCCITTAWRERNQRHRHRPGHRRRIRIPYRGNYFPYFTTPINTLSIHAAGAPATAPRRHIIDNRPWSALSLRACIIIRSAPLLLS